jgi:NMD protein affecting ribosome stability and mRNA decay
VVQLRQKRSDDSACKAISLIEMAIRNKKEVRQHILNFETTRHGFDFYFLQVSQAQNFAQYLSKVAPMRTKTSSKLVSTDNHCNTANIKYTLSCDLVPFGRDDLIVAARNGGGGCDNGMGKLSGKLALVTKCKSVVHLVNASPSRTAMADNMTELNPDKYWKAGEERCFRILLSPNRMVRFVVLDVEVCGTGSNSNHPHFDNDIDSNTDHGGSGMMYKGPQSGVSKYALADVEVARESDFGVNDETFHCVTHLGHLLQVGDTVLGYDLQASVDFGEILEKMNQYFHSSFAMPDVVLVRKVQGVIPGGGAGEDEDEDDESNNNGNGNNNQTKSKAKSSSSKKRMRRMKKEEKKMQDLGKAASRMGFVTADNTTVKKYASDDDNNEESGDGHEEEGHTTNTNSTKERQRDSAFEEDLKHDPELEEELRMAEQAIHEGMLEVSSKSNSTAAASSSAPTGTVLGIDKKVDVDASDVGDD